MPESPGYAVTPLGQRGMQVVAGGRDLTSRCDSLVFSAVDNGGFEICTLGLPAADRPAKGTPIVIRQGLEVAWAGRVAEIADHSSHAHATKTVGCEGYQALLKDNPYSMIYIDRDLSQWKPPGTGRMIAVLGENYSVAGHRVTTSQGGFPAVVQEITGAIKTPKKPLAESWYDAGAGNRISYVYYNFSPGTGVGVNWYVALGTCADDVTTSFAGTTNINVGASGYFNRAPGMRFAVLQMINATYGGEGAAAGEIGIAGQLYTGFYYNLTIYGDHGLVGTGGADPQGYYPVQIALHALSQARGIDVGVIGSDASYVVPHCVYRTPVNPDVVINDMAKLMGWTWGVWEPVGIFADRPRLDFRPPPTDATAIISKAECDELDITSRLGDLYDTAVVSYTTPAGALERVTVTLENPQLAEAGIVGRTLQLDAGLSLEAEARTFGAKALALSQVASRAAGQATLPASVKLPNGGSKPSALLRPGIDRLRITDLIAGGSLLEQGTSRRDVFRISRTETTVTKDGVPSTRVELDNGTNLMELLQARQALAAGVVGSGAG